LVVTVERDRKRKIRRKSMLGTVLFALGIIGAIAFAVTGSVWVVGAAVVFLVAGVLLLYQVGKSLP
jgi:general stress protein CsbA